jgi:hypothetical protein
VIGSWLANITSEDGFGSKIGPEGLLLLEVFEQLDGGRVLADSVLGRVGGPNKLLETIS